MEEIEGYEFGHVYEDKIEPEDAKKFATVFGEGSKALTELIEYCILNGISTLASCKGHPEEKSIVEKLLETGYITFNFEDDDNFEFAYYMANVPLLKKGIIAEVDSNYAAGRNVTLRVPAIKKDMCEKYFEYILESIKEYRKMKDENKEINIDSDVKKIVDYMFEDIKCYETFEITYKGLKKYERDGIFITKVSTCPLSNYTSILHKKFNDEIRHSKMIDEFINSESSRK